MNDYKDEIASTRKGCLGSSDGKILMAISEHGEIGKTALKRLAVCKGLIPQTEIPKNAAILTGDKIEMAIYEMLKAEDTRFESNPLLISNKYSRKNCKLITHPDFLLKDEESKILKVYECKATKFSIKDTIETYKAQLYIHLAIATEIAQSYGKDWKVRLYLVHYSTEGLELENGVEFEPERLTVRPIFLRKQLFDINKAMNTVDTFLETFNEYYDGDVIDANYLPEKVAKQFEEITNALKEIKEREAKVDEFKKKLYDFMRDKDIKSIVNDYFAISRIDPTDQKSFDWKKYLDDLFKKHPRVAAKVKAEYQKVIHKSGYATIKIKDNKKDN